ncbi:dehydrase and lipid transport domain-containing protein [Neurospora intermedia]|uniref:Dehydrase and lipid transport domain-containing protein n=1 Tax=Neurospora intermedia TaxID=5142 RepID=A0ABR3D272_NEUIN
MPPRPTLLVPPGTTRLLTSRTSIVRSLSSLTTTTTTSNITSSHHPHQRRISSPPTQVPTTTTTRPYSSWLLSAVSSAASSAASALNNASGSPAGGGGGNNSAPETVLRARRILPYPPTHLYNLIADVSSYSQFLPHCSRSVVTAWAEQPITATATPAEAGTGTETQTQKNEKTKTKKKWWPARGELTVGWGPFTESYSSRVYCVPDDGHGVGIVEAVSGNAATTIPATVLQQFGYHQSSPSDTSTEKMEGLFESLVTRWTVRSVPAPGGGSPGGQAAGDKWTEVALSVRFKFASPALGFAVGQLAGQKVDEMVAAFEERARRTWRR